MGWWIFKSAKEKYMGQLVKRLDAIEHLMNEEREDDMLDRIDARIERLERMFVEPEAPPVSEKPAGDLAGTTAMLQGIWTAVPDSIKPFVNKFTREKTGKTIEEWLEDSRAIQAVQQMGSKALGAVMQKTKTPERQGGIPPGLLPEEMPQPTGNVQMRQHGKEKEEVPAGQ